MQPALRRDPMVEGQVRSGQAQPSRGIARLAGTSHDGARRRSRTGDLGQVDQWFEAEIGTPLPPPGHLSPIPSSVAIGM